MSVKAVMFKNKFFKLICRLIEGKWNRLPDMKVARYNHALGYHKNHLIAIGGNNNDQDSSRVKSLFNFLLIWLLEAM